MKKIICSVFILAAFAAHSQETTVKTPAAKGVVYGVAPAKSGTATTPEYLEQKMVDGAFTGTLTGRVKEVCKTKGCWITLEKEDGTALMVKSKDHAFYMPQNLIGRTVVMEGTASVKEISESMRKHLAEDAGKGKEEISKIKGSEKKVEFIASGVKVLD